VLRIDPTSGEPLGEQVRRGLRRAIAEGAVHPGDVLPPVRQLAGDLGIHWNTVARAYRDLEAAGLVRTMRGRGTVVAAGTEATPPTRGDLRQRLRDLLADARLAGYGPESIRALVADELDRRVG
jgi:DNA-binding transcriptional regulator YhcF (GntR family)